MGRKNPMVRMGRPPRMGAPPALGKVGLGGPAAGASPMQGFSPSVPGASFRRGGGVHGHKPMPAYHDDPNFCKGGKL